MTKRFKPRTDVLPEAQRQIWPQLEPMRELSFVLYGGTAIALHLGHRQSIDFDFFRTQPLDKRKLQAFVFMRDAVVVQEDENTLVVIARVGDASVKLSFFGGIAIGRIDDPFLTDDSVLLVASPSDLLATKLKAILDRAEAKDYQDIAALLRAGQSLENALGAFQAMWKTDPALPLKALGFFKDGDLSSLSQADRDLLCTTRDRVRAIPNVTLKQGLIADE